MLFYHGSVCLLIHLLVKIVVQDVSGLVKKQIVKAVRKEEAIAKKAIKEKEKIEKMTPPVIILPKPELDAPVVKGQVSCSVFFAFLVVT